MKSLARTPAALLLVVLAAGVPACAEETAPAWTPTTAPAEWLVVTEHVDATAERAYQALLREDIKVAAGGDANVERDLLSEPRYRFALDGSHRESDAGEFAGSWDFLVLPDARWPHAATRVRVAQGDAYRVDVDLYCTQAADCAVLREKLKGLRAPAPAARKGGSWSQWLALIRAEACEPGADNMPAPRFPASALWNQGAGEVVVGFAHNACGDVRANWIATSSNDSDIDRAALDGTRAWRLAVPPDKGAGTTTLPITFAPDEPPPMGPMPPSE